MRSQQTTQANPFYAWIYGSLGALVLIGLAAPLAFYVLRLMNVKNGAPAVWSISGALLFCAALMVFVFVYVGGIYDQRLKQLLSGDYWAHWSYTPEEQYTFAESEVYRQSGNARTYAVYSLAVALGAGLLAGLITSGSGHAASIAVMAAGVSLAAGALLVGITYLDSLSKQVRIRRGKEQQGGEAYLNATGMVLFGRYIPYSGFNLMLEDVSLQEGPPALLLFRSLSRTRDGVSTQEFRLPVPNGKLAEAESLVEKFRAELKKA